MFETTSILPNFIVCQFHVATNLIINGGGIRLTGLLFVYSFLGIILISCRKLDLIESLEKIFFKIRKVGVGPFSKNSLY